MRIISGKNRGVKLAQIGLGDIANNLRPTSDRVRESTFNLLINGKFNLSLEGARVLDVFAGTGALGFESLSRGAKWVTFIEKNSIALEILKKNIVLCKENNSFEIKQEDVTKIKKNCGKAFDLIFLDPPYGTGVGEQALLRLIQEEWISKDATIVFENDREVDLESFRTLESRKYGKTIINILRPLVR